MTVTLSPKNARIIATYAPLTGYTQEELTNLLLADYLGAQISSRGMEETIGCMSFKDKESAERVQAWLLKLVGRRYYINSIETEIINDPDGTFRVYMTVPDKWEKSRRCRIT